MDVAVPHFRGSSTHVMELARHLNERGVEVHVIARKSNKSQKSYEKIDGVHYYRLKRGIIFSSPKSSFANIESKGSYRGSTPRFIWKMYEFYLKTIFPLYAGVVAGKIVRDRELDVILERESSFGAGAIASMLTGRPFTLEVIGNRVTNFQLKRSSKIIAYSKSMFRDLVNLSKIEIISAAVDTNLFTPLNKHAEEIREQLGLGSGPVIGYVGTFQEWHGIGELLDAARGVVKSYPNARFLMVGPYFRNMENLTKQLGLSNYFVFTGPVPYRRVPDYISACDVLLAPYNPAKITSGEQVRRHGLGSPLKVFEYLSSGKPTITTLVEPISSIISDHFNGILIQPGDSVALEKAMIELLDSPNLASLIGKRGRELVLEKYSWDHIASKVSTILRDTKINLAKEEESDP